MGDLGSELRKRVIASVVCGIMLVIGLPLAIIWGAAGSPSSQDMWRAIQARWTAPAVGTHFTILVADLVGDDTNRTQTRLLAEALAENRGLEVMWIGRALEWTDVGSVREGIEQAELTGQQWLAEKNADILIWGRVVSGTLQLRFLPRGGGRSGSHSYGALGAELELPNSFSDALAVQLAAVTLSHLAPATSAQGRYLVETLLRLAAKIKNLQQDSVLARTVTSEGLTYAYGLAMATVGKHNREPAFLEEAVKSYQKAQGVYVREQTPLAWAATHAALGDALLALADEEGGTVRLEAAVAAFQTALEVYTPERTPSEWAAAQAGLGSAVAALQNRQQAPRRLEQAVATSQAALVLYTREQTPLRWAVTRVGLRIALSLLGDGSIRNTHEGQLSSKAAGMEEALATYQAVLAVYTRERAPLLWAAMHFGRGIALTALAHDERGIERLEKGVAAFRAAQHVFAREQVPLVGAATQFGLGVALTEMGKRQCRVDLVEEAVAAHRDALKEFTPERMPLAWAATQYEVGYGLLRLGQWQIAQGEWQSGTALLEEAVAAFRAALQEFSPEQVPTRWAAAQDQLGVALALLGERDRGTARLEEAAEAFRHALEVFRAAGRESNADVTEADLRRAEALLAERGKQ
jgi:tetratricopeptide (TPR) repeat protein